MKRMAAVLVFCSALIGCFVLTGSAQAANTTAESGWWTQTNPGSVEGSPEPPPPPDVPAHGLLVEGGPQSTSGKTNGAPTAFAAVVFQIPAGSAARRVRLSVAPNSATTPSSQLELCPLTNPGLPVEYGGPMSDAPGYNCTKNVVTGASSDGSHYTFDVATLASDDALAVAILPTSPVDRVALSPPSDASLVLEARSGVSAGAAPPSTAPTSGASSTGPHPASTSSAGAASPSLTGTLPPATPAISAPAPQQQTPQVATAPESNYQPSGIPTASASTPAPAKPRTVVVLIAALALGLVLWQMVGRAAVESALRN